RGCNPTSSKFIHTWLRFGEIMRGSLSTQRLQELASAKSEIDRLRSYAERDPERVYIRASCAKNDANSTPRVDDATRARPTDAAIRNYWILRERIAQSESIILGLQDYIRQECIN
ncbi:lysis protein, partial [Proteus mirabilis]